MELTAECATTNLLKLLCREAEIYAFDFSQIGRSGFGVPKIYKNILFYIYKHFKTWKSKVKIYCLPVKYETIRYSVSLPHAQYV